MGVSNPRNVGAHIKSAVGIIPQSFAGSQTVTAGTAGKTTGFDRSAAKFPKSCTIHLNSGAASGAPTASTAKVTVYDSPDGTTWTKYVPPPKDGLVQTEASVTVDNRLAAVAAELDVDLSGADKFIGLQLDTVQTAGTSPAAIIAATITAGGAAQEPI